MILKRRTHRKRIHNHSYAIGLQPYLGMHFIGFLKGLHRCFSFLCLPCLVLLVQIMYGDDGAGLTPFAETDPAPQADYLDFPDLEEASINQLLPEGFEVTEFLRNTPMPKLSKSRLGQILSRFYEESMGGAENFAKLNSVRIIALYNTLNGEYAHEAISKKPNMLKVKISNKAGDMVIAYNGTEAWKKMLLKNTPELILNEHELRRLAVDAEFTSYLLYPFQKGKAFEYLGILRESDRICHRIRVHTQEQFVLDYFIDVETFRAIKLLQVDKLGHFGETELYFSDYRMIEGIPFAYRIESFIKGDWHSVFQAESIELNVGLFDWMFDFRGEDYIE